jgi:hypothetical protein
MYKERVIEESEAETTGGDSYGGRFQPGDPVSEPKDRPGQNPRPAVDKKHPSSFEADQAGKENQSKQIPRLKNLGLSKIANFLTICVLVGSAVAFYFFEQGKLLHLNKSDMVGREPISERPDKSPYPEVFAEGPASGTPAIQAPAPTPPIARKPKPLSKPSMPGIQKPDRVSPKVYLHTSKPSDHLVLEQVGDALRVEGYTIPETRLTSGSTRGDVRFFFPQDRHAAERIKSVVEAHLTERGYHITFDLLERDGNKFQFAAPGKIEVWVPPLPKS